MEWKIYLEIVVMVATAKLFVATLRDLVSILWTYDCVTPQCTVWINFHSSNIIYLITCDKFQLHYVEEIVQKLKNETHLA